MSGALLGQSKPNGTTASTVYTASQRVEITRVVVCNTANAARQFSLFHDEAGTGSYSTTNALYYSQSLSANTTMVIDAQVSGGGFSLTKNAKLGANVSATDITFTFYGIPQAPR